MPLFLEPLFQTRIWGGTNLKSFGYDLPNNSIGECWGISAHPNGANIITNGTYKGQTLDQVWEENSALFGDFPSKRFPLMTKILDANDQLSVQVHPDDSYAYEHENGEYGKTECWYIIDAEEDAEIIYGTTADSKEKLNQMIDDKSFDSLFKRIKVKPGEFYYVPAGTVHGIGKGITILETQQTSDTTYRIYDYDRVDSDGNKRDLHLEQSKDVITIGEESPNVVPEYEIVENHKCTTFVSNDFFTVEKWEINGTLDYMKPREFCLISVIDGEGEYTADAASFNIKKGDHFILTSEDLDNIFVGQMTLIISYV